WWRHPFYQPRWKMWHAKWMELAANTPKDHEDSPKAVLGKLTEINCDPDVVLRLAFLDASQKPATKSDLAGDSELQQRIKRMSSQSRNHVLKAAVGLEQALSDTSLIFIVPKDVESLRALADMTKPESVDSLRSLAQMCYHEIEALLWPHAVELRPGHELFTLVSYVVASSGEPHFPLVADLMAVAHQAYDLMRPTTNEPIDPVTKDAIEKQVRRFRKLDSIQPGLIEESTAQRAKSGELRRELLTCYPDQALR